MRKWLALGLLLLLSKPCWAFQVIGAGGGGAGGGPSVNTIFNCSAGFTHLTGPCGVALVGESVAPFKITGSNAGTTPSLVGSQVDLIPVGAVHNAISFNYQTLVNIQVPWTATFTFVPNGSNVSLMFNNSTNNPTYNGSIFSNGAGCEANFFQGFSQTNPPNFVWAIELDSYSPLTEAGSFVYSSAQVYTSPVGGYIQCPCVPNTQCGTNNTPTAITKLSTSPVPLNSPAGTQDTTTGDTYSATVAYDGTNISLKLYDVTAGGSCPGASCYSATWPSMSVATSVGANSAWIGLGGATGTASIGPLMINSFVYSVSM